MKMSGLKYDGKGLIPAVVQEADTGEVLRPRAACRRSGRSSTTATPTPCL
jgi:hypothetical protein